MTTKLVLSGLALATLAACSGGSSGGGSGGGGLTPGAGYANDTLAIDVAGETIDTGAVLLTRTNLTTFTNESVDITLTTTSNANEYLMTYNGQQYTLAATGAVTGPGGQEREFEYTDANISFNFLLNFDSDRDQLIAGWLVVEETSASPSKEYLGTGIFGFTTDPAIVAARTGTADYLGQGNINVQILGANPAFTSGFGDADLTVHFNTDAISGSITNITEIGSSQTGHELVGSTSATINQATISNGTINGTITLADPNKFGLLDQGTVTYDGKFYESYGTGVGAYITGNNATAADGTTPAIISGAFVAEECPTPSGSC